MESSLMLPGVCMYYVCRLYKYVLVQYPHLVMWSSSMPGTRSRTRSWTRSWTRTRIRTQSRTRSRTWSQTRRQTQSRTQSWTQSWTRSRTRSQTRTRSRTWIFRFWTWIPKLHRLGLSRVLESIYFTHILERITFYNQIILAFILCAYIQFFEVYTSILLVKQNKGEGTQG